MLIVVGTVKLLPPLFSHIHVWLPWQGRHGNATLGPYPKYIFNRILAPVVAQANHAFPALLLTVLPQGCGLLVGDHNREVPAQLKVSVSSRTEVLLLSCELVSRLFSQTSIIVLRGLRQRAVGHRWKRNKYHTRHDL